MNQELFRLARNAHTARRIWWSSWALAAILIGNIRCSTYHAAPPPTQNCTFNISGFMSNCTNPTSSGNLINYRLELITWYWDGNSKYQLDSKSATAPATTPKNQVTLVAKLPSNNIAWSVEITVVGEQCSLCSDNGNCAQVDLGGSHIAALPRWYFFSGTVVGPSTVQNRNDLVQISNVPGSCGCTVND